MDFGSSTENGRATDRPVPTRQVAIAGAAAVVGMALVELERGDLAKVTSSLDQLEGLVVGSAGSAQADWWWLLRLPVAVRGPRSQWREIARNADAALTLRERVDVDIARVLTRTAELAYAAGKTRRVRWAGRRAIAQWDAMGRPERAERVATLSG